MRYYYREDINNNKDWDQCPISEFIGNLNDAFYHVQNLSNNNGNYYLLSEKEGDITFSSDHLQLFTPTFTFKEYYFKVDDNTLDWDETNADGILFLRKSEAKDFGQKLSALYGRVVRLVDGEDFISFHPQNYKP